MSSATLRHRSTTHCSKVIPYSNYVLSSGDGDKCSACGGTGKLDTTKKLKIGNGTGDGHVVSYEDNPNKTYSTCPKCKGQGRIKMKIQ